MSELALARVCGACNADLERDLHRPDCEDVRRAEIGWPAWRVLRLSRAPALARAEAALEECNRRARAWLKVRGRNFP